MSKSWRNSQGQNRYEDERNRKALKKIQRQSGKGRKIDAAKRNINIEAIAAELREE